MNKVYQKIASAVLSSDTENTSRQENWEDKANALAKEHMPSGSGFDCGTELLWDKIMTNGARWKENGKGGYQLAEQGHWNGKLVFKTSFHHMDEGGGYDGWTDHVITVKPHLVFGFTMTISGSDRNQIKDYIGDTFEMALNVVAEKE